MISKLKFAIKIIVALTGSALFLFIDLVIIYPIVIPDACIYHVQEMNWFLDLFFEESASEGYHVFPNNFQLLLFAILGFFLTWKMIKKITQFWK